MNIFNHLISLFRSNKDIPNPRPETIPYSKYRKLLKEPINNRLEFKNDLIIIHAPTFEATKAVIDALNYLKIKRAFEEQQENKKA